MQLAERIEERFRSFNTFTSRDVRMLFSGDKKHVSDKTLQVTLSRMKSEGRIYTITKGVFSLKINDELVGFAFSPFYYGGLSAMMMRELTDKQVRLEIMTTKNVKNSILPVYDGKSNVFLHHIPKRYYFGFEDLRYGDMTVPVSNPEKTLIDLFYYKTKIGILDYGGLLKAINKSKLNGYLEAYDNHTRTAVLNFVKKYKAMANSGELDRPY
jgi:predicted transcriptional regulator of viral defense system